jgi:hypothetical protein
VTGPWLLISGPVMLIVILAMCHLFNTRSQEQLGIATLTFAVHFLVALLFTAAMDDFHDVSNFAHCNYETKLKLHCVGIKG